MAADQDPPEDDQDPDEDTPDDELEDTADDADDAAEPEWEPKSRLEAQRKISEQGREIARLRGLAEGGADDDDEDGGDADDVDEDEDDEGDDETPDGISPRLEAESWELARSSYGDEAVAAFKAARRSGALGIMPGATPMDAMTSFMVFHDRMLNGGKPPAKVGATTGGRTRSEALAPRVDTNRSDSPDSIEADLAGARKSKSLDKFASAAAAAMGFGPTKRR